MAQGKKQNKNAGPKISTFQNVNSSGICQNGTMKKVYKYQGG